MNHWSQSAKETLEDHLRQYRSTLETQGVDADEVVADLRRHVEEELSPGKFSSVNADDVRRVLAQLGASGLPPAKSAVPVSQDSRSSAGKPPSKTKAWPFAFFFGVMLPVITLLIEVFTHFCGGVFFDPIPTWWHVAALVTVPVSAAGIWSLARKPSRILHPAFLVMAGFALFIAFFYSIVFLPLSPYAAIGIIFFGIGFLPLTPLLSLAALIRLLRAMQRQWEMPPAILWKGLGSGFAIGVAIFSLINARPWLTLHWADQISRAESVEESRSALKWLRRLRHEETLLAECYRANGRRNDDLWTWEQLKPRLKEEDCRNIYFQVTGRAFNSVPPPQLGSMAKRWDYLNEWSWDDAHGGTAVAGKIKGLTLQQSRIDGLVQADEGWAYMEWIMEFKNTSRLNREARAQILLPPGGVVSRLTLWVNGEEREAAFAGAAEVRKAYTDVAVVQRRDPVLVTSAGEDRVLMQCFPVLADGGTMKIRVGITVPWSLLSETDRALSLPSIIECNFGIPSAVRHAVWLETPDAVQVGKGPLKIDATSKPGKSMIRGDVPDALLGTSCVMKVTGRKPSSLVRAVEHRLKEGAVVEQRYQFAPSSPPERVILVIDGAVGMNPHLTSIAEALEAIPSESELVVLFAKDGEEELIPAGAPPAEARRLVMEKLRRLHGEGGQDNQAALLKAIELSASGKKSVIVWVHGPQPVSLDQTEKLSQHLLWRGGDTARIHELQTDPGPNRVMERPEFKRLLATVPRFGSVREDLQRLLSSWRIGGGTWNFQHVLLPAAAGESVSKDAKEASHVVRLWANGEILRLIRAKKRDEAVALAARYQLVTPISGAVVLETAQQFRQAGLEPLLADTVPTVPEPTTWMLLVLGSVMLILARRRSGRRVNG